MLAFEIILRTLLPFRSLFSAFFSSFPPLSLILQCSSGSILGDTPIYLSLVPNPIPPRAHRIINLTKAVYWFIDFSVWLCHLSVPKLPTVCRIKFNFLGLELKACYHLALPSCPRVPAVPRAGLVLGERCSLLVPTFCMCSAERKIWMVLPFSAL